MTETLSKDDFFNRYDIDIREGRLGGGSFGTVYKAYDNERDQVIAVKVSEVRYINNKEFSLQSEFDATKDLPVHKNIANYEAVYQLEMPNGLFDYAIMQYYPDGNLKELVKNNNLTLESKKHIIDGLIKGLQYLHKNGIIHRDIKPSNILISERKGIYTPKIADFGLSKIVDSQEMEAFTNSFGGGTLEYSSPEQLLGERLRYNADLWAVGIIAYELLTGTIPFSAKDISGSAEAKRKVIYQNIVNAPIPALVKSCPAPYNEIIRRCLIKDPTKRVQKAEALLSLLNSVPLLTPDDNQETLFLEENVPQQEEINIEETNTKDNIKSIKKYSKWIALLILLSLMGFGASSLFKSSNDKPNIEKPNKLSDIKGSSDKNEIAALLAEDPDNQNDDAVIEQMKSIRLEEEKGIWNLVLEDGSVTAYEEYLSLYPDGLYADEAKIKIAAILSGSNFTDEESVWKFALENNSISAFQNVIDLFPNGKHSKAAQFKIALLERKIEEKQWSKVANSNSLDDLNRFISLFPNSKNLSKAKTRILKIEKDIEISKAYKKAKSLNTIEALETFLNKYPASRYEQEIQNRKQKLLDEVKSITTLSSQNTSGSNNDQVTIEVSPQEPVIVSNPPQAKSIINDEESDLGEIENKASKEPSDSENDDTDAKSIEPTTPPENPIESRPAVVSAFIKTIDDNMATLLPSNYKLGCDQDCDDDAMPSTQVIINPIKVSKYEVTQKEYKTVMGKNPSFFNDCDECPVENISFYDAQEYIKRLNSMPDNPYKFRLPTEAEWEYAASAESKYKYAGGDKIEAVALYKSNSRRSTGPVNSKKSNKNILFCMSGNVYEWCDSWYSENGYQSEGRKKYRVIRGGSWSSKSADCKVKSRGKTTPDDKRPTIGMRLVRDI